MTVRRAAVALFVATIPLLAVVPIHAETRERPAPTAAASLAVVEVAPGVFVHSGAVALADPQNGGDIANLGFVVGEEGVAVIDTGGSLAIGAAFLAAVRARTGKPVLYVINTHMHPDHSFGNAAFRGAGPGGTDPVFVGHAHMGRALATRAGHYIETATREVGEAPLTPTDIVVPGEEVADTATLDLGGRTLLLTAWPTAHTDNDLTVLDTETGTLFAGDLLFMEHLPVVDGSIAGWLAVDPRLAAVDAARVVPGHGPAVAAWPDALVAQDDYLESVAESVRRAIAEGVPMARAVDEAEGPAAHWALADAFHRRNLTAAYAELEWE